MHNDMSYEEGALIEPLSVAVYACQKGKIRPGQHVLIMGCGTIGLLSLMTAKAFGASCVCVTDLSDMKLQAAQRRGADHTICLDDCSDAESVALQVQQRMGRQPDCTIDCVGVEETIAIAIHATKPGGKIVSVGYHSGQIGFHVPFVRAMSKELDIRGVFRYRNTWPLCMQMLHEKKIDVKSLVTHVFPLESAIQALETARLGIGIKVMIDCEPKHVNDS